MRCGRPRTPGCVYGLSWAEDVGDHGDRGNGWVVRLAAGLVVSWHVLGRPLLVTVGFGPELLLKLLHHPLQVLPGLPLQQQVGSELLAVGLGVLQLHLEVLDLENKWQETAEIRQHNTSDHRTVWSAMIRPLTRF